MNGSVIGTAIAMADLVMNAFGVAVVVVLACELIFSLLLHGHNEPVSRATQFSPSLTARSGRYIAGIYAVLVLGCGVHWTAESFIACAALFPVIYLVVVRFFLQQPTAYDFQADGLAVTLKSRREIIPWNQIDSVRRRGGVGLLQFGAALIMHCKGGGDIRAPLYGYTQAVGDIIVEMARLRVPSA